MSFPHDRRFASLPNIGGLLLGLATLWFIRCASEASGGMCAPFPGQVSWFALFVVSPAAWSIGDLLRGALTRSRASLASGAMGLVLGLYVINAYETQQHCRN